MGHSVIPVGPFVVTDSDRGAGPDAVLASDSWVEAVVPGGVHESLLAAGRIEHPYRDRNESSVRWIEDRDWWFRGSFDAPTELGRDERLRLRFLGLDTVVELWLNGEPLGRHENMFRPAVFDVTDRVRPKNDLMLRFRPPLDGLEAPSSATELTARLGDLFATLAEPTEDGSEAALGSAELQRATLRRKATFSWGWDFGPRVPSIGIWRPVELSRERIAVIDGHHLRTDRIDADGTAHLSLLVEVDRFVPAPLAVTVVLRAPDGREWSVELPVQDRTARGELAVPDAALWWTHDLGEPALHTVMITLTGAGGESLDELVDEVGLRTIALDRSADPEGGRLFRFLLNGVPIFARGANWLPADLMVGSVTAERHRQLVRLARDGGMIMLRIWGGGVYEHDSFYAACDELGVLVWHDFMFACMDYPSELAALQTEVAAEAEYQVRRLRNRASLALWCGNNEVQLIHGFAYRDYEPGDWGWDFFHRILPETVAREDPTTPYWPGSPWGEAAEEGFMAVNGVLDGDRHAWEVWHGFDFGAGGGDFASVGEARHYRRYARDRGKFISEFGIHASPELGTLRRWISAAGLEVHSPTFDDHNKDNPKDKGDALLEIITGLPTKIEQYVDFTMVSQAEGLKFGIEHYRRRQPHNNGTLIWQFNDVWPGFSWSVIDYDLVPKAGYYFAKRAYSPVLASFRQDGDRLELWLSNSGRDPQTITAEIAIESFTGERFDQSMITTTITPAHSEPIWTYSGDATQLGPDRTAWVSSPQSQFPQNRHFFSEIRELPLTAAPLDVECDDVTGTMTITSPEFAYFVHLPTPTPGITFSDNYLDLRPNTPTTIKIDNLPSGLTTNDLQVIGYAGTL
jgi:beta-mannosidase